MRFYLAVPLLSIPLLMNAIAADAASPEGESAPAAAAAPDAAVPDQAMAASDSQAAPVADPAPAPGTEGVSLRAPGLSRLDLGGTVQIKALYHDMASDRDADKRLSLQLRRFRLDLDGSLDPHFGFRGEFLVDGNNKAFGVDNAYLAYTVNSLIGFRGGKLKRPFSQEALQSSKSLYTIERGELYQDFLAGANGYSSFDLGLIAYGGFLDEGRSLGYEVGVFNGKQNEDPHGNYHGQQYETQDQGFKAKDVVLRVTAAPFAILKLDAAVSTKAAENRADPGNFDYAVNTAYVAGADLAYKELRLLGEVAWGDNHANQDSKIVSGSTNFFAFYAMGVWREDYPRGRASELVLKLEGLEPDYEPGDAEGSPNDGKLRYTLGCNYFFTPKVSVMADYGVLQHVTKVIGERRFYRNLDLLWRMGF